MPPVTDLEGVEGKTDPFTSPLFLHLLLPTPSALWFSGPWGQARAKFGGFSLKAPLRATQVCCQGDSRHPTIILL